jgi:hypothetical protein
MPYTAIKAGIRMSENQLLLIRKFTRELNRYGLSRQQIRTLKGQALAGDFEGARVGLEKILRRAG